METPSAPPCPPFYSQQGEDFLLDKLFADRTEGFFVEVGCIDGRRFSNSLHFEQKGWKGLCVEAHADYIDLLTRNRPGSIIEHAAVGPKDEPAVEFFANSRGSLSTLDKNKEREFAKKYGKFFTGFRMQTVPMRTLNTIFQKHGVEKIGFVSLDIEGSEVDALKGMALTVYRPIVFVIESDSSAHRHAIHSILLRAGYHFVTALNQNLFYSLVKEHRMAIGRRSFEGVKVLHTAHPLDSDGDREVVVRISTQDRYIRSRLGGILGGIRILYERGIGA